MGERHRPIRARSTPGQVAGAATKTARTRSPSSKTACPTAFSTTGFPCARCPANTRRTRRTLLAGFSCPDTRQRRPGGGRRGPMPCANARQALCCWRTGTPGPRAGRGTSFVPRQPRIAPLLSQSRDCARLARNTSRPGRGRRSIRRLAPRQSGRDTTARRAAAGSGHRSRPATTPTRRTACRPVRPDTRERLLRRHAQRAH